MTRVLRIVVCGVGFCLENNGTVFARPVQGMTEGGTNELFG